MAPKHKLKGDENSWWRDAYRNSPSHTVTFEWKVGKDVVTPGTLIKVKYSRHTFKFRCLVEKVSQSADLPPKRWFDCIDIVTGEWRSFRPEQIKGVAKAKKRRKRSA